MTIDGHYDVVLDERGTVCPMPIIALAKQTKQTPEATILLLADDPAAASDIPAWCAMRSRVLIAAGNAADGHGQAYLIAPAQDSALDIL